MSGVKRGKLVIPLHYREGNFAFPAQLSVGVEFDSIEEFQRYLEEEANIAGAPLNKLFHRDFRPTVKQWNRVRYRCRICSNAIRLSKNNDKLVVTTANINHAHAEVTRQGKKKRNARQSKGKGDKPTQQKSLARKSVPPIPYQQATDILVPEDECSSPLRVIDVLKDWLSNHKYSAKVYLNKADEAVIDLIVFASPSMKDSFSCFGDLLHFEIMGEPLISEQDKYRVGVFSVVDTNQRPLAAALVAFREESPRVMSQALKAFTQIHRGHAASTFVTGNQSFLLEAIGEQEYAAGVHQVSADIVFEQVKKKFHGSTRQLQDLTNTLRRAVICRDQQEYKEITALLSKQSAAQNSILEVIERNANTFYCRGHEAANFIGLGTERPKKFLSNIGKELKSSSDLIDFIKKVDAIDTKLKAISKAQFLKYEHDISCTYSDQRLAEIRESLQERVVERFIQNYTWALREYTLTGKFVTPGEVAGFVRSVKGSEMSYEVRNWKCECRQLERTGVPCAHMLLLATTQKGLSYLSLVNPRWKKVLSDKISTT